MMPLKGPWDVVRRWTQRIWDSVEKGIVKWGDDQLIQNLRVNIATAGKSAVTGQGGAHGDHKSAKSEVICRAFNSRGGCRSTSHHDEGGIRHLHICAFCDLVGRHCPSHNVIGCDNKTRFPAQQRPSFQTPYVTQAPQQHGRPQDSNNWRSVPNMQPAYNQFSSIKKKMDSRRPPSQ